MKNLMNLALFLTLIFGTSIVAQAQIDNLRANDKSGLNVFEDVKTENATFDGVKVKIGGHFTQQFQALNHSNTLFDADGDGIFDNKLYDLQPGFNLATANLNVDVQLAPGIRMNLVTYLSSRHHPETWVKGGYIQFDELPFIKSQGITNLMDRMTIRVGHMEINYGDSHFRRTDNGNSMYNPFVGNYIVDAFNTEIGTEFQYKSNNIVGMLAITGGELNGNVTTAGTSDNDDLAKRSPSIIGKAGYDGDIAENVRLRLTGSVYYTASSAANHLFDGDRAGSRYYLAMESEGASASSAFRSGRYNPSYNDKVTSMMLNAFVKAGGFEFFGTYENSNGRNRTEANTRNMNQFAVDALYRFGTNENIYLGGRYNVVNAEDVSGEDITITRYQIGAGWFVTDNLLMKLEYVNQDYRGFANNSNFNNGNFNGIMVEAAVGF
jgi:hypothetical protein